jgi:predicted membrane channel-forming protein YqfA (hemolysin III family)
MNTETKFYQSISFLATITGLLLLVPLAAMQFTDEVIWTLSDFIFAGVMIFGSGLFYKFVTRQSKNILYKVAIGFGLLTGFFLIWVNLAVGIVGSEDNPANLMYFAVIGVGLIGSFISRFDSEKMEKVMYGMALTQGFIAAIILLFGLYQTPPSTVIEIIGVNSFFIVLFAVSGLLFRYVAGEQNQTITATESINSGS